VLNAGVRRLPSADGQFGCRRMRYSVSRYTVHVIDDPLSDLVRRESNTTESYRFRGKLVQGRSYRSVPNDAYCG
jgi:hypothetical protein